MNLFELFVKIGVDDQASEKLNTISGKLGKGLASACKIGVTAVTVASTAISALTGVAIKNFAEYEQLVGGVETLFGNSADKVKQYANEAYKTAGLSANEYMNTVTSFSASLLQSLGGDTAKAADYADRAITDMSDNANKMGTDMAMIQNAYQGFAKQNYTMLDNLKLGYGGTKEEMQRLLGDAERLSGQKYDISSFADIVDAIHVVQTEMGITGATAKEAATTISGSFNSMKAAWQNLITGMADSEADFDSLINNMVESAGAFADNILPRIEIALGGVGNLVEKLAPKIIEALPGLIETVLPSLANSALGLLDAILNTITSSQDQLIDAAMAVVMTLVVGLLNRTPDIISAGLQLLLGLVMGISENLPVLIPAIIGCIIEIVEALLSPDSLSMLWGAAVSLILNLANGLIAAIPTLIAYIPQIIISMVDAFIGEGPKKFGEVGLQLIQGLWNGIKNAGDWLWEKVKSLLAGMVDKIKGFFGIASPSKLFRDDIGVMLAKGIGVGFDKEMSNVEKSMKKNLNHLTNGLNVDGSIEYGTYDNNGSSSNLGGRSVSVVQNIYSQKQTAADLMQEAQWNAERAVYMGV